MRTWDVFLFRDELDVLEMRLTELDGSRVWRHVLIEAPVDHQGHPKPLHYAENRERFAAWNDRIIHVVAALPAGDPWARINAQRDAALPVLADAGPDDVVHIADVDEIPSLAALAAVPEPAVAFRMWLHPFAVDWQHPEPQLTGVSVRRSLLGSLTAARDRRSRYPAVDGAGRHFTFLGGQDAIRGKLQAFCHLEQYEMISAMNERDDCYRRGHAWWHPDDCEPVTVDETWPEYIRDRRCPPSWFRPR
jgi:hypothetical protein